jgi:hypothetical protein
MKFANKKIVFAILAAMVIVALMPFMQSCSNTELDNIEITSNDLPYLSLEKGTNFSKLSEKDLVIVSQAFERIQISRESFHYTIKQTSGKQVNISTELFEFIIKSVSTTNALFKERTTKLSNVRFKTVSEITQSSQTDCLARAIGYCGGGTTYNEANDMILSNYGNGGVPLSDFLSVCYTLNQAGYEVTPSNISSGPMNKMIIVIRTGSGIGHAVNGMFCNDSGDIIYYDAQNNSTGYCTRSDIISAFSPF